MEALRPSENSQSLRRKPDQRRDGVNSLLGQRGCSASLGGLLSLQGAGEWWDEAGEISVIWMCTWEQSWSCGITGLWLESLAVPPRTHCVTPGKLIS